MPTVSVDKEELYKALGRDYTFDEFMDLCFDFGIELEEDTTPKELAAREVGADKVDDTISDRAILKIDIPANRYDLLCHEGISRSLKIYLDQRKPPVFKCVAPPNGQPLQKMIVKPETAQIRPYVVCAVLRNIKFTELNYKNFIDLQDKLHQNICRKRTLVAIGTHDLDTIQGPFTYEALAPKDIVFTPLNKTQKMNAEELMTFYETDKHLNKYLPIIRDSPVYPIIYDKTRQVLSLPPIINSDHSKITLDTKNVFIECTGTDLTKAKIVLNTMVAMFSEYCAEPFTYEAVEVEYEDGRVATALTPDMASRTTTAKIDYINGCTGLNLSSDEICNLLNKMSLNAQPAQDDKNEVVVEVPPTRSDVLHQCDIMEDVAIAYGFNNLPNRAPSVSTIGKPYPINKLADIARLELALAGWSEVSPLTLCSHDENFAFLRQEDPGNIAVKLAHPKTVEYQVVRTSLLPGVLKTLKENKKHSLPIKIFEVGDTAIKDDTQERRSRNVRKVCATYSNKTSGLEHIHGLLDRVLAMVHAKPAEKDGKSNGYWIQDSQNPTYFPSRAADIYLRQDGKVNVIGTFGILHPEVLEKFGIPFVTSAFEFELEHFL
ncbi:phenylalanine--tRNA ligase subunit beta [Actinomortierella ambigua]|uniref:phenylalanine--tRNA ligase n=1 Tax=Actinomortierella ambigua TaxID=1343610 RepID=A0A9P6QBD3_9FUNG|nr:phenylalanine--tRNA ligase subunit beta [Actinomortierella ambigua]